MKNCLIFLFLWLSGVGLSQSVSIGSGMPNQSLVVHCAERIDIGTYAVCGSHIDAPASPEKAFVSVFIGTNPLWTKIFEPFTRFLYVRKLANGDLIVSGEFGPGYNETFLCRFSPTGAMLWRKNFSVTNIWNETPYAATEDSDGNIWLCGEAQSRQLLMKVDGLGNPMFGRLPSTISGVYLGKVLTEPNGIIAFGSENNNGFSLMVSVHRFDLSGNEIAHKLVGLPSAGAVNSFRDAVRLPGGGYVITTSSVVGPSYRVGVIVLDANLNFVTSRIYSATGQNLLHPRIVLASGSTIYIGCTIGGAPSSRTLVIKTTLANLPVFTHTVIDKGRVRCQIMEEGNDVVLVTGQDSSGLAYVGGGSRLSWVDKGTLIPSAICDAQPAYTLASSVYYSSPSILVNNVAWNPPGALTAVDGLDGLDTSFPLEYCGALPLPVEMTGFTVELTPQSDALLKWSTATERENDLFTVERSADGNLFEVLGSLPGAGNSQSLRTYQFLDGEPLKGVSYYRLGQVDYSGDVSYSDIVEFQLFDQVGLHTIYGLTGQVVWQGYGAPPPGISGLYVDGREGVKARVVLLE